MIGAILAGGMKQLYCDKVNLTVQKFFFDKLPLPSANKIDLFRIEFLKHGKIILFIWLMAFIPSGNFFLMLVLFLKGVSYGFTSSVLFSVYKLKAAGKIKKNI